MIEKVQFRNFKAYRSLDLELEPFTVLVGPNASGKTTLLEGLRIISETGAESLGKSLSVPSPDTGGVPQPAYKLMGRSHGETGPIEWHAWGTWQGVHGAAHLVARVDEQKSVDDETPVDVFGQWGTLAVKELPQYPANIVQSQDVIDRYTSMAEAKKALVDALSSSGVLRLELHRLAEASYSDEAIPQLDEDGEGLGSVLAYLKLSQDEVFEKIEAALRKVVPSVVRIRIERAAVEQDSVRTIALDDQKHQVSDRRKLWGSQVVLDMKGAKGVSAGSAGEGTLMVLGLLTVLMGPRRPRLVLLDDIELSLHPTAQGKLIEVLRTIQKNDPELQIVATSHSPFILNYLRPEEVRMTFLAENGFARCEKLTAHPDFEKWKDLMSPGEFWSTVGESWIEKVPASAPHE
ncbi:AAA family ATPase [Corallococcus sicarius]|uniref:AAA+ ATPase domain-containing protein n=1 Tax=Corallococcus sicarius TaxID=2316726 RepID=A0A3A8NPC7_9BACT|nr:ATP-binding protein [Corallococcus sicarius]RKH41264.1 hypothetical protein D7X12_18715 [Corallococcus sicarius]